MPRKTLPAPLNQRHDGVDISPSLFSVMRYVPPQVWNTPGQLIPHSFVAVCPPECMLYLLAATRWQDVKQGQLNMRIRTLLPELDPKRAQSVAVASFLPPIPIFYCNEAGTAAGSYSSEPGTSQYF